MKVSEKQLGDLLGAVADYLAKKIASDEASASDVSNAIKLLKDNNITCEVSENNSLGKLQEELDKKSKPLNKDDLADALEAVDFSQSRVQ